MRFYLKLLKNIIKVNVGKSTQILVILILLAFIFNIDSRQLEKKRVIHEFKDISSGSWVYIESAPLYTSTEFNSKQYIYRDKTIRYFGYSGLFIFLIVVSSILGISVIVASFMDDANWDIDECIYKTYLIYVKMDCENTKDGLLYIYSLKGRLLCKSYSEVENYVLKRKIEGVLETPNLFLPYAGTKSEIRNNKLDNILK